VYLDDDQRVFKNEAICIEILSGKNAGFMTLTMHGQLGIGWEFQLALRWLALDSSVSDT